MKCIVRFFFFWQQFSEHICGNWSSMADKHYIQLHSIQRTIKDKGCRRFELQFVGVFFDFCGLHYCACVQTSNIRGRTWRAKGLGLDYMYLFHVALAHLCGLVFSQGFRYYLILISEVFPPFWSIQIYRTNSIQFNNSLLLLSFIFLFLYMNSLFPFFFCRIHTIVVVRRRFKLLVFIIISIYYYFIFEF